MDHSGENWSSKRSHTDFGGQTRTRLLMKMYPCITWSNQILKNALNTGASTIFNTWLRSINKNPSLWDTQIMSRSFWKQGKIILSNATNTLWLIFNNDCLSGHKNCAIYNNSISDSNTHPTILWLASKGLLKSGLVFLFRGRKAVFIES